MPPSTRRSTLDGRRQVRALHWFAEAESRSRVRPCGREGGRGLTAELRLRRTAGRHVENVGLIIGEAIGAPLFGACHLTILQSLRGISVEDL